MSFTLSFETRKGRLDLERLALSGLDLLGYILDVVGQETVAYLRSYTGEMRPPARTGSSSLTAGTGQRPRNSKGRFIRAGDREAHPGHWADITHDLERSYGYRVNRTADGVQLVLFNDSDHAVYVEAMDGYFVLRGIMEPGGVLETKLREIIRQNAPGWTIR